MKKKIMVFACSLLLYVPVLSFSQEAEGPDPNTSAYEHADENAKFKRTRDLFFSKEKKEIRAKRRAEKEAKKAEKAAKKLEEAQDKGEGQVKIKF